MKRRVASILPLFVMVCCMPGGTPAQVTLENSITTDSIDLFSREDLSQQKSPALAMAASLAIPGSGHQYLGRYRSALAYITVEAVSVFSFFLCDHFSKKTALDAAGYAWVHSGASGTVTDADDNYWKIVGSFMDVQDYNNVMDLNRTPDKRITEESMAWHWDDQQSLNQYNSIRSTSRSFHIASSFFLGALVLNRIIAFVDIRTFTRTSSVRHAAALPFSLSPHAAATPKGISLSFAGTF